MALALNNLKRVDMPLNKETKPKRIEEGKQSKISPNINQLIKSTVFISRPTKRVCMAQGRFFKVGPGAEP